MKLFEGVTESFERTRVSMACLDTSVMIDFFRGTPSAVACVEKLIHKNEVISITAPTIMELATGAELAQSQREKQQILAFLESANVLPLDKNAALQAGKLNATLLTGGDMIDAMDIQIGAIAAAHGDRLITRNAKHFRRVPGLVVEGY